MNERCVCCGRRLSGGVRVERGRMHMDCYTEHHCGPETSWPPGHQCAIPDATEVLP